MLEQLTTKLARVVKTMRGQARLTEENIDRAVNLSMEKYCSASAMMAQVAELTHDFEVIDTAG